MQDKIAIISDIHIGAHSDNSKWHSIAVKYAKWLSATLKERGITELFILGDVFDNRKEVGVATLHAATLFFQELSEFKIRILTGNHDSYYSESSEVNSLSQFDEWDNITVYSSGKTILTRDCGKTYMMCPWGAFPDMETDRVDTVFGHFEINGFYMTRASMCEGGVASNDILKVSKRVFSGHFHMRDVRDYGESGSIVYVGSPYQLNWGDADTARGVYLYDFESDGLEFIENTVSPKHIKVDLAQMADSDYEKAKREQISGNIIKVCSTGLEDSSTRTAFLEMISNLEPLEVGCDIKNSSLPEFQEGSAVEELEPEGALMEYIDGLEIEFKDEIRNELRALYIQASNSEVTK